VIALREFILSKHYLIFTHYLLVQDSKGRVTLALGIEEYIKSLELEYGPRIKREVAEGSYTIWINGSVAVA
jgi:hypothetical protein